jgi:hypothetical protein
MPWPLQVEVELADGHAKVVDPSYAPQSPMVPELPSPSLGPKPLEQEHVPLDVAHVPRAEHVSATVEASRAVAAVIVLRSATPPESSVWE